ncbi:MAG: hypothetical protein SGILL_002340, partial [Bacillariaceae sp.]
KIARELNFDVTLTSSAKKKQPAPSFGNSKKAPKYDLDRSRTPKQKRNPPRPKKKAAKKKAAPRRKAPAPCRNTPARGLQPSTDTTGLEDETETATAVQTTQETTQETTQDTTEVPQNNSGAEDHSDNEEPTDTAQQGLLLDPRFEAADRWVQ